MTHRFRSKKFACWACVGLLAGCSVADSPLTPLRASRDLVQSPAEGLHGAIAFHSSRAGNFHIFVMNADGSDVRQLTRGDDFFDFDPVWSPNGQQLTFTRFNTTFTSREVVLINEDGSGERVVGPDALAAVWSPNGKQLAVEKDGGLYLINVDGTGLTKLLDNASPSAFSPNGKQIAFRREQDGNVDIYVVNVDGTGLTRLTDDPAVDFGDHAGWSPDGKQFLFSSTRDGGDIDIFVMNPDGTNVRQLTFNDCDDDDAVWSPDGKQIVYQTSCDGGDEDLVVRNADGSHPIQITTNDNVSDAVAAWRARPLSPTLAR